MARTRPILLMTRPQAASEGFLAVLREAGADGFDPVISPVIDTVPTGPLPPIGGETALIFTSANAVAAYRALGGAPGLRAWAVGAATGQAARAAGLQVTDCGGDADALVARIAATPMRGRLLHLRGEHARGDVAARLTAMGHQVDEAVIYAQPERPLSNAARAALTGGCPVILPLFSPRSAALLARARASAPLLVAAMSEAVAKQAAPLHSRAVTVAVRPDAGAMCVCVLDLLTQARHLEAGHDEL